MDLKGVKGTFINETVRIFGMSMDNVQVGLATSGARASGILGIGFDNGEAGIYLNSMTSYPNLVSQLVLNGYINSRAYSIWLDDYSKCQALRDWEFVDLKPDQMERPAVCSSAALIPQNTLATYRFYLSLILSTVGWMCPVRQSR